MKQFFLRLILILSCFLLYSGATALEDDLIDITFERVDTSNEIKFISKRPINAAVFLNGNRLWFIIDQVINVKRLDWRRMGVIKSASVVQRQGNYTIGFFEIINQADYEITSTREDNNLILRISSYDNSVLSDELTKERKIIKNIGIKDNSIDIQLNQTSRDIVKFKEPFTGEELFIIPEIVSARTGEKLFVDFALLESLSGVIIKSLNDSLEVSTASNNIQVSSSTYLNISGDQSLGTGLFSSNILKFDQDSDVILNLANYNTKPGDFPLFLKKINSTMNNAYDPVIKSEGFLNLSLFLLANKWYSESKSALELVNRYSDIIGCSYKIKTIVTAIYFMADAFNEAKDISHGIDIKDIHIKDRSEVRFWQKISALTSFDYGKLNVDNQNMESNLKKVINKIIDRKNNFLSSYNNDIFNKICFKVADIAIRMERFDIVRAIFIALSKSKLEPQDVRQFNYLNGKMLAYSNDYNGALAKFKSCMDNVQDRYYYSKCKFEALNIMYKLGEIDKVNYINNLQGLTTVWRGDDFEFKVLDKLGNFYNENNDASDAIRTWKIITNNYPGSYNALISMTKASQVFVENLNSSTDTKLEKLAFFYEFSDLIPLGDEGDQIIMQTASYMLDLDMVDQAIKIIEYQIKNRLIGIGREYVINDLITIYSNMNKWDLAEKTVEAFSKMPLNIVNPVIAERRYLYVDALIESGQMQDAIAVLYGDTSSQADTLRAKAFFKLQDWNSFNDNSEPYLYSIRYNKDDSLSDSDYLKILRQNISYFSGSQINLINDLYLDLRPRFKKGKKNAERNKIFYHIANELQDGHEMTEGKKAKIQELVKRIISS